MKMAERVLLDTERLPLLDRAANNIWHEVPGIRPEAVEAKVGAHVIWQSPPNGDAFRVLLDETLPGAADHQRGHVFSEAFFGAGGGFHRVVVTDNSTTKPTTTVLKDDAARLLGDSLLQLMTAQ